MANVLASAKALGASGKFEEAQKLLDVALGKNSVGSERQQLQGALVMLHLGWGRRLEAEGKLADALDHFAQVYRRDTEASPATTAARLGHVVELAQKLNRDEDVVHYATLALPLCQNLEDKANEAWLQGCIGLASVNLGKHDKAIAPLQSALALYQQLNDTPGSALAQFYSGRTLMELHRNDEALPLLRAAAELYQKLDNKSCLANSRRLMGVIYRQTLRLDESLAAFQSAIPLYKTLGDTKGEGLTLSALGLTYRDVGHFREALDALNSSLPLLRDGNEKSVGDQTLQEIKGTQEAITNYEKLFPDQKIDGFMDSYPDATDSNATKAEKAQQLVTRGAKLYDGGYYMLPIPLFYKASQTFHELKDTKNEAEALHRLALDYRQLDRFNESLVVGEQELKLYRELGDKRLEGRALNNLGFCHSLMNRYEEAKPFFIQALDLLHQVNDRWSKSELDLINTRLISIADRQGEFITAIKYMEERAAFFQEIKNPKGEGFMYLGIAMDYESLARVDKGLEYRLKALPLFQSLKNAKEENRQLRHISINYETLGNHAEAVRYSQLAIERARQSDDKSLEAVSLYHLGWMARQEGKFAESVDFYNQALNYFRVHKPDAHLDLALLYKGETQMDLLEAEAAKAQLQTVGAANAAELPQDNALTPEQATRGADALSSLSEALSMIRLTDYKSTEAEALAALMRLYQYRKQPELAIIMGKEAVNIYQTLRSTNTNADEETKEAYVKTIGPTYKALARLLINAGRFVEAEEVLAMIQQDEFIQFVRRGARGPQAENVRTELTPTEKPVVAEHDDRLASVVKLSDEEFTLDNLEKPTPQQTARLAEVRRQMSEAKTQLDKFFASMPVRFKRNEADVKADQNQLSAIQPILNEMGGRVAQVSTFVDDNALDLVLTMPSGSTLNLSFPAKDAQTDGKPFSDWLNARIFEFTQAIQTGAAQDNSEEVNNRATELNNVLSCHGALHHQLKEAGITTLMWRLNGPLRSLPLAALRDSDGYWLEKYQNVVLTAGSSDLNLTHKSKGAWKALGLGVTQSWTVEGDQFPALSGVKNELQAVVNAPEDGFTGGVLPGRVLEDGKFTEISLFRSLRGATPNAPTPWQVIHFASHFKLSSDDLKSFLLLGDGTPLTIASLQARAKNRPLFPGVELMTLSACQTAQGTDSLGALAEVNGAKSVIATLWPVADKETVELMTNFYKTHAKSSDKGKIWALQQAQLALLNSGKTAARPYFWAPFVLMGNWQ